MKKSLCLLACLFLISSCAKSPEPSFVYYKNSEPTSCNLVIGLSHDGNQLMYKVTTDVRSAVGNFTENGQQIVFSGLFASRSFGDSQIEVSVLQQGDTLFIQNYGNSMNPFTLFSECDSKYLSLVRVHT